MLHIHLQWHVHVHISSCNAQFQSLCLWHVSACWGVTKALQLPKYLWQARVVAPQRLRSLLVPCTFLGVLDKSFTGDKGSAFGIQSPMLYKRGIQTRMQAGIGCHISYYPKACLGERESRSPTRLAEILAPRFCTWSCPQIRCNMFRSLSCGHAGIRSC